MAEGPNDPQDPFLYQEGGKTYASLPGGDATEYSEELVVREDGKRLQSRRNINTKDNYGKEPSDSYINSKGIPTKGSIREKCLQWTTIR